MRHLERKEGEMGKRRRGSGQATPAEHGGGEEEEETERRGARKHKPRQSCRGIDGHGGMLRKLNCAKRPTKHNKHCPRHKQQHLARLGEYNIHPRSCCLVALVYLLCDSLCAEVRRAERVGLTLSTSTSPWVFLSHR